MKRKIVLAAFLLALLGVAGCMTPRQKAYAALNAYEAIAIVAVEARVTGQIPSDEMWSALQEADRLVYARLMAYVHMLQWGEAGLAEYHAFMQALADLEALYRKTVKEKPAPLRQPSAEMEA